MPNLANISRALATLAQRVGRLKQLQLTQRSVALGLRDAGVLVAPEEARASASVIGKLAERAQIPLNEAEVSLREQVRGLINQIAPIRNDLLPQEVDALTFELNRSSSKIAEVIKNANVAIGEAEARAETVVRFQPTGDSVLLAQVDELAGNATFRTSFFLSGIEEIFANPTQRVNPGQFFSNVPREILLRTRSFEKGMTEVLMAARRASLDTPEIAKRSAVKAIEADLFRPLPPPLPPARSGPAITTFGAIAKFGRVSPTSFRVRGLAASREARTKLAEHREER